MNNISDMLSAEALDNIMSIDEISFTEMEELDLTNILKRSVENEAETN